MIRRMAEDKVTEKNPLTLKSGDLFVYYNPTAFSVGHTFTYLVLRPYLVANCSTTKYWICLDLEFLKNQTNWWPMDGYPTAKNLNLPENHRITIIRQGQVIFDLKG